MKKNIFLILLIISSNTFSSVIHEREFSSNGNVEYKYEIIKDNIFKCSNKECNLIFNKSDGYCNDLSSLKDEVEADIRARWICPKVYAFNDLYNKYRIKLSDNPIFAEYTLNLYRIMENDKHSLLGHSIKIDDFEFQVGMSPEAFFIPADINDIIKSIIIKFDRDGFVTEEYYSMEHGDKISRRYKYKDQKIVEIITDKVNEGRKTYTSKSVFTYD
ncbi:hypothetical protein [Actinobacillus equuli]|uniref:hypothetical protein n=1 Tax=Actinobacillus equuli TaxID=718 RepID=UPI0024432254|nr:hypothetical protein [Actinobacillus equuli]WGE85916.1 hypothetical protein NYR87_01525 [Actinobacillus equuli subsp. haemolyticus]